MRKLLAIACIAALLFVAVIAVAVLEFRLDAPARIASNREAASPLITSAAPAATPSLRGPPFVV